MGRHQKNRRHSGGKLTRLGPPSCFLAFLLYFLLPLIYYIHLTEFSLPASYGEPRAGPSIIWGNPEKPPSPYHDNNSCPICQAASSCQDYTFFPILQNPDNASLVRLSSFKDPNPGISNFNFLVSRPRSPPVIL
jgi:hypothetical protein